MRVAIKSHVASCLKPDIPIALMIVRYWCGARKSTQTLSTLSCRVQ